MSRVRYVRNCDVRRILFGVPRGHLHARLAVELSSGETIVFSEATVAAIVRAYTLVKTHPIRRGVEMELRVLSAEQGLKEGYAECQLLETEKADSDVGLELTRILEAADN